MKRSLRFCAALALISSTVLLSSAQAQKRKPNVEQAAEDDIIRVSTTLVTVPVSVKDRHGKSTLNLRREDFRLYEDGVEQEIAYFESAESPNTHSESGEKFLTIALLLDVSDSTEFKLKQIQDAALAFIDQLRTEDRVLIIAFDRRVQVLAEATKDRKVLREAIGRTQTGGGTSLYAALDAVINHRLNSISGHKAIVLLTDGVDTTSKLASADSTLRGAEQLDAAIYPIQYHTYGDFADNSSRVTYAVGEFAQTAHMTKGGEPASEAYKRATLYLRLLADRTGGHFGYTDNLKNLSRSFARIASELRQQYALGFYPKNRTTGEAKRELKVSVSVPNAVVRARESYIYRRVDRQ